MEMGTNMKKMNLFAGMLMALAGMVSGQSYAATGCYSAACDPGVAAACTDTCGPAVAGNCGNGCATGCNDFGLDACAFGAGQAVRRSLCNDVCWSGYINAGYDSNTHGNLSNGFTDCFSSTSPAFNAAYISATKKAFTGGCGFDWGFGVDFMFGEDARLMQSSLGWDSSWDTGSMYNPVSNGYDRDSYGFAMPQFYAEVAFNNWSVKMGHFYGLLGYEGVKATDRFFYTKGLSFQVTPITQTGVLASYNGFENLDITLGWVNGWNNGFDNSVYSDGMVTGAFTYHMNKFASLKYAFQSGTANMADVLGFAGPFNRTFPQGKAVGSMHNLVLDLQLTDRLDAVSTLDYGDYSYADNTNAGVRYLVLGQHLYYTLNSCWKVGMRAEWLKGTNVVANEDTELTSLTFGANWNPCSMKNLTIRPELRYDRAIGQYSAGALNGSIDQITMGFDAVLTF